jgi:plastocyanin
VSARPFFARSLALLSLALAAALVFAGPAVSRRHRLHAPTPPLPSSLAVDEQEWSITPSQTVLAAGEVTFHAYDRGMDAHNMTLIGPNGDQLAQVSMQPGGSGTATADLPPGNYQLVCTLYAGTPQSHEALGMHTVITVR